MISLALKMHITIGEQQLINRNQIQKMNVFRIIFNRVNFKFIFFLLYLVYGNPVNADSIEKNSLRTGFYLVSFPDVSLQDLDVVLRFWSREIGKQSGIPSTITLYKSLERMKNDFDQGKINFIVASPLSIVINFDLEDLAAGYKIVFAGHEKDKLLVVTHTESGLKNFKQLKNKKLSLLINDPISRMYADVLALKNFAKKAHQVLKITNPVRKSSQLIFKLFFKNTDVIFVYKYAYDLAIELNPQIQLKTQVIAILDDIPPALGFFHHSQDPEFRRVVIDEVLKFDKHPRGQQILSLFYAEKTVPSSINDLKTVQELHQKYLQLIKQTQNRE